MNYQIHTFGCKVNTYDTGLIQKKLNPSVLEAPSKVHILNTCAVTAEATKEAQKLIRRLKSKDPFCTIVVTGCGAQVDTDHFKNLASVDLVVANSHKSSLSDLIQQHFKGTLKEKTFKSNIFKKEDLEMGGGEENEHTRAFLKIQDGCNSFCSYCIIPFARGKSRSISINDLVRRVNELYNNGVREVVLTGVHIGDYSDSQKSIEDLIEGLLMKTKMPRFRLSSFEPVEITDRLLDLYSDTRLCPHFHMSIQSANDEILRLMKRNYKKQDVVHSLNKIQKRVKNSFVGMDVIVGFPSETEEQFIDTMETLKNLYWTKIHVFPYSEREGTRAAVMTDVVSRQIRQKRSELLRQLSAERFEQLGKEQSQRNKKVLILNKKARGGHGISEDNWPIFIQDFESFHEHWKGEIVDVMIHSYQRHPKNKMDGYLMAEVVDASY